MKQTLLLIPLILFFSTEIQAQHKLGDIEVSSFEEIFNPKNENLWKGKNMGGSYKFNSTSSKIWVEYDMLSALVVDNKYVNKDIANFVANDSFDPDEIFKRLEDQFTKQFGDSEEVKDIPAMGGGTAEGLKWIHVENQNRYSLLLQKYGQLTVLSIQKLEEIPDFD